MQPRIDMITLWTDDFNVMKTFYRDVMGFTVGLELDTYVEFINDGVRFAICNRGVLNDILGDREFGALPSGQIVELAFRCDTPAEVDDVYVDLIARGADPVRPPSNMDWNQRTAFFSDPDGNIHEIFADMEVRNE